MIKSDVTVEEDVTFTINSDRGFNYVETAGSTGITVYGAIHVDDVKITS